MTAIKVKYPPKRTTCARCGAKVTRIYTGNARSIDVERGKEIVHRCPSPKA